MGSPLPHLLFLAFGAGNVERRGLCGARRGSSLENLGLGGRRVLRSLLLSSPWTILILFPLPAPPVSPFLSPVNGARSNMPRVRLLSWGLVAWLVRGAETDSMSDQSLCFQGRGDPLRTGRDDSGLLSLLGPWPGARASPSRRPKAPAGGVQSGARRPGDPGGKRTCTPRVGTLLGRVVCIQLCLSLVESSHRQDVNT